MKKNYTFKVGDRVQFKTWEEMEKEFGCTKDELEFETYINCKFAFIEDMKHLCGTFATIRNIDDYSVKLKDFTAEGDTDWSFSLDMLKPVEEKGV